MKAPTTRAMIGMAIAVMAMLMAGTVWAATAFVQGGQRVQVGDSRSVPLPAGRHVVYVAFTRPPPRTYGSELGPEARSARVTVHDLRSGNAVSVEPPVANTSFAALQLTLHEHGRIAIDEAGDYRVSFEPAPPRRARALVIHEEGASRVFWVLIGLVFVLGFGFVTALALRLRKLGLWPRLEPFRIFHAHRHDKHR